MSRRFLAVLVLLVVFAWATATTASDSVEIKGFLNATENESDEGYFFLGPATFIVVKPGSDAHTWLQQHRDQHLRVTIRVDTDRDKDQK